MGSLGNALCEMHDAYRSVYSKPLMITFNSLYALNHFLRLIEQDIGAGVGELGLVSPDGNMFDGIVFKYERPPQPQTNALKFWAA